MNENAYQPMEIGWTSLNPFNLVVKYFFKLDPAYCMRLCFGVLQET